MVVLGHFLYESALDMCHIGVTLTSLHNYSVYLDEMAGFEVIKWRGSTPTLTCYRIARLVLMYRVNCAHFAIFAKKNCSKLLH